MGKNECLEYKGYVGSCEIDVKASVIHGKILFINDLVTYEAESVADLANQFRDAVDDYLEACAELGREPNKPCSGTFNIRVGEETHRALLVRAAQAGLSLNDLLKRICRDFVDEVSAPRQHQAHYVIVQQAPLENAPNTFSIDAFQQPKLQLVK